jgi:hypothetical protein
VGHVDPVSTVALRRAAIGEIDSQPHRIEIGHTEAIH